MTADYHVHTYYSDDSDYPMEEVVRDAISTGITDLCFTDHVDYGIKRDWDDPEGMLYRKGGMGEPERMPLANVDYPAYAREIQSLKERYAERIAIQMGMEFGVQRHTVEKYRKLFQEYSFDFIILSVHEIDDKEFWTQDFQRGSSQKEYNERYYEEMLWLVQNFHEYSVLGHMDLITRYDKAGIYPFEKIRPLIAEILRTVIADGKGIEVNTSCYRYGLTDLTPSREILRLYRNLGGEILTIGSDSHRREHLGMYLTETMEELKEMGFQKICTFRGMKPEFHRI